MPTNATLNFDSRAPGRSGLPKSTARTAVAAALIVGLSATALPSTARAGNPGVGAAIGLGILGGVIAGAAIASTTPAYPAPQPYYAYPNGYYAPAPGAYPAPQPYYGPAPSTYPPGDYGYYYGR